MTARTLPALFLLALSLALAGCGNKGPLVLPDRDDAEAVQDDEAGDEVPEDDDGDPADDGAG